VSIGAGSFIEILSASTEYVRGMKRTMIPNWVGMSSSDRNVPERNAIGNLRKLESIWASGTHFA